MTDGADLGAWFDGPVVPEATPSPRTIRFATPPLDAGPSRAFDVATRADDPRVARVFDASESVTNVLVGPTFVAVTIGHADEWESVLAPLLRAVTDAFTGPAGADAAPADAPAVLTLGGTPAATHEPRTVDRAWTELGSARADDGAGLDRIVAASRDAEPARRQVAAVLLADAPPDAAARHWARLLDDASRSVRRAAVDTMSDAARPELRDLLERALADPDAWIRWRALRGLAALSITPSLTAVTAVADDPDFRVRLEAARVLAGAEPD